MGETSQIFPKNYYQILLKIRVVNEGGETSQTLPKHCPTVFYKKMSEHTRPLIEVKILPIISVSTALKKKKDRTEVLSLI
jgi:hypothetical protein